VGFIGYDGDGLAGVEYSMDNRLKASNELLPIWEKENILGNDIILTINMPLQNALKEEIQTAFQDTKAKSISAVVMDPSNGDILAMGNYPDFDPNNFTQYNNYSLFKNNVLSYIDEPGSTFKPLIMAYLLDNQKISEKAKFQCDGKKNLYGFTIRDEKVHGWVDPRKIITYSCNVGMALASQELTRKELYGILKLYGLGKETGINLPGEEKGIIRTPNKMTLRSKISIPIGQEIGIPPMQLVKAYSAIANDGLLISPRIVKKIEYNGKTIEEFPPRTGIKILTQKTADKILSYMRDVVLKGTGREADIPGVWIGGKTGTAQIFDFETRTYSKVNTSFVSIVKDKKGRKYIIYVVIRNPEVEEASGGKLVAPLVKRIAQKLLDIYNK
jgi:cell division protein FtsI/penicillin-binding protein 2